MKHSMSFWVVATVTFTLAFRPGSPAFAVDEKLLLAPEMVVNESGLGDAGLLVDEQEAVGDPLAKTGTRPERPYFAGWQKWVYPVHLIIDCGSQQEATTLAVFNESGTSTISISGGTPISWTKPQPVSLDGYRQWQKVTLNSPTRYLRITLTSPTSLAEVVAYGVRHAAKPVPVVPAPKRLKPIGFDQFLGVNAFIDDPIDKIVPVAGTIREYHGIGWDYENADHKLRFQPSGAAGGNAWFFDDFYAKLAADKRTVVPCLQSSLPWLTGEQETDAKPSKQAADPAEPAAYADHAAHLFQFAARYGTRIVPDEELTLAPGQPRRSGLGLIHYFENANEPDKNWKGRAGLSTPFEFAAQCSADYDGHRGKLGPGHGIRTGDPEAKMVMGGLYRNPLVYLDAMRFWAEHHRGGSLPLDVINVHDYCNDGDAQQAFRTRGISPEAGELRRRASEVVAWRDRYAPGVEVWVTEFGYDTNPASPLHAPAVGDLSAEVVQAAWLVRSNLLLAAAGVDRATMFMFRDVDTSGTGVFATCGLVTQKGSWKPKPSWYFQSAMKTHLAGMWWEADVPSGQEGVIIMRFGDGKRTALVAWCSTSNDHREPAYRLAISGTRARRVELATDLPEGRSSELAISNGSVTINVTEVPTLIFID